jgi:hypothetical protein
VENKGKPKAVEELIDIINYLKKFKEINNMNDLVRELDKLYQKDKNYDSKSKTLTIEGKN